MNYLQLTHELQNNYEIFYGHCLKNNFALDKDSYILTVKQISHLLLQKNILLKQLEDYISVNSGCLKQGTEEWKKAKEVTIGGSEIATIQGVNRFSSILDLIYGKIGIIPRKRDIKMQWGKVFEPLICEYVEIDKNVKIQGQDLFILGKKENQSYSPDGLGVMLREDLGANVLQGEPCEKKWQTVLFEFKCPFNRLLKGGVPEYYLPQVLTGLDTIPIVDKGLYIEAMFRRCLWENCDDTPTYDRGLTPRDLVKTVYEPLARGFVLFVLDESKLTPQPSSNVNNIMKLARLHNMMKTAKYTTVANPHEMNPVNSVFSNSPQPNSQQQNSQQQNFTEGSPNVFYKKAVFTSQEFKNLVPYYMPLFGKCLHCEDRINWNASDSQHPQMHPLHCKCGESIFNEITDLGDCPIDIFEFILDLYEDKILVPWYSTVHKIYRGDTQSRNHQQIPLEYQLSQMIQKAKKSNLLIYGMLPYKMLRIEYNYIDKIPGYVESKCQPIIDEVINVVKQCKQDPSNARTIVSRYITAKNTIE